MYESCVKKQKKKITRKDNEVKVDATTIDFSAQVAKQIIIMRKRSTKKKLGGERGGVEDKAEEMK